MKKHLSLFLAALLLLCVSGCASSEPAPQSVGRIGSTSFSSGLYLLLRHEAYQQMADRTEIGKSVLRQKFDGQSALDYLADQTLLLMERYAAVEQAFSGAGLSLTEQQTADVETYTECIWSDSQQALEEYGITRDTLTAYMENLQKADCLPMAVYGSGGPKALSEEAVWAYAEPNYFYGAEVLLPLRDSVRGTDLSEDDTRLAKARGIAQTIRDEVRAGANPYTSASEHMSALYALLGSGYDASALEQNVFFDLYTPETLHASLSEGAQAALFAMDCGECEVLENEADLRVFYRLDLHDYYSADKLRDQVASDLFRAEMQLEWARTGAALEHALDPDALNYFHRSTILLD